MVKKRLRRVSSRSNKVGVKRNISNPFNRFSNLGSSIKEIPLTEKTLLIALLVFIGVVAFSTNHSGIKTITGAFTDITGSAIDPTKIGNMISDAFRLITQGILKPVVDIFGSGDILVVRVALMVVAYFALSIGLGLRRAFGGKGNIIAFLLAAFGFALVPEEILRDLVNFLPGVAQLFIAAALTLVFLIALHRYEIETSAGHVLKSILYFMTFMYIANMMGIIEQRVTYVGFQNVVSLGVVAAMLYAIIMSGWEIINAIGLFRTPQGWQRLRERDAEKNERLGREREGREDVQDELRGLARNVMDELEDLV